MVDPFLDEKIILTLSSSFSELATEGLKIEAIREAYGATKQEGLCHEFCAKFPFQGQIKGDVYFGMDGYSKVLILPYITRSLNIEIKAPEMVKNAMMAFVDNLGKEFLLELKEIMPEVRVEEPENYNFKLIDLPDEEVRKYMTIYFLKDSVRKKYLGRVYLYLVMSKD